MQLWYNNYIMEWSSAPFDVIIETFEVETRIARFIVL